MLGKQPAALESKATNIIGASATTDLPKAKVRSVTIALMFALLMSARHAMADSCGDILHDGVFDVVHISDDQALKETYHRWQCVIEVNDWSDAKGFGLGIGVPIYGVPVKIDTNYTKNHREQWKRQNCKTEYLSRDSRQVRDELYRHANPDIVAAWKECMFRRNTKGLRCEVDGDDGRVILTYRYDPYTKDDAKIDAILDSFYSYGVGACFGSPGPDTEVGVADAKISCEREHSPQGAVSKAGFVLNLKNGKGSCDTSVAGRTAVAAPCAQFAGTREFETDVTIREQRICMKEGTVLRLLHGHSLTIEAEEISIEGSGALIDASGDPGGAGGRGGPGNGGGTWRAHTDRDYHNANGDCSAPGHPDRGHQGGQGGSGGPGGKVVVRAIVKGILQHNVKGCPGGPGGPPGQSMTHIRPDGRHPWPCPNEGSGPPGPPGTDGSYSYEPQNAGFVP